LILVVERLLLFERGRLIADGQRDKVIAMLQAARAPRRRPRSGKRC